MSLTEKKVSVQSRSVLKSNRSQSWMCQFFILQDLLFCGAETLKKKKKRKYYFHASEEISFKSGFRLGNKVWSRNWSCLRAGCHKVFPSFSSHYWVKTGFSAPYCATGCVASTARQYEGCFDLSAMVLCKLMWYRALWDVWYNGLVTDLKIVTLVRSVSLILFSQSVICFKAFDL